MNIVGVGATICMGYCSNIRNGTAIAAPDGWVFVMSIERYRK